MATREEDITDEEFGAIVGAAEGRAPWARHVVSRWLAGKRVPRRGTRAAMAGLVGMTLDEFDGWNPGGEPGAEGPPEGAASNGTWLTPRLRRQLDIHLNALRRDGAAPAELWAAEQLLTHHAIVTLSGAGPADGAPRPPSSHRGARRPRRGIPAARVLELWAALAEVLRRHIVAPDSRGR
ncbi:MAG: hypothetical protein ABS52_11075 [Gemmatimonadetes bacterium SCN 70-22]|nr:MAG: hypothetical protein ABS52_11075 [Gemmatimonadetes bacterium SCN 70-22]